MNILGIHHITAITKDAQTNIDFYTKVLGLRLVKLTVNADDPSAYHLYFGDATGTPGTIMTFFAWPGLNAGSAGTRMATQISFKVPPDSLEFWEDHLGRHHIEQLGMLTNMEEDHITFEDLDGHLLRLVETEDEVPDWQFWTAGDIPKECAIRGLHGIRLGYKEASKTKSFLEQTCGFKPARTHRNIEEYTNGHTHIYLQTGHQIPQGIPGTGTIHHVAWQVTDDDAYRNARIELMKAGIYSTEQTDRSYFHSIYFREPGGVLFEISTNGPGFSVDEDMDKLGTKLVLPPQYESLRETIENQLPKLILPEYYH
jgi:glyoxalase family protein